MRLIFLAIFSLSLFSGCADFVAGYDRIPATKFEPLSDCSSGYRCFSYQAPADMFSRENSESGERYRLKMLEAWLNDNGCKGESYEIVSRIPVKAGNGGFVFYKIRVKE